MIGDYYTDGVTLFEVVQMRSVDHRPKGLMQPATIERYFALRNCKTDYLFEMDEPSFAKLQRVEPLPDDHEPTIAQFREALDQWTS